MCHSRFEKRFISSIALDYIGFEDPIEVRVASYNKSYYEDRLYRQYGIDLPEHILRSVMSRRAEYLAGRVISKIALEQLNSTILQVGRGEHRSPIWPTGMVGSISHDNDSAICVVKRKSQVQSIGLDIEPIISDQIIEDIKTQIVSEKEYELIELSPINNQVGFTIIYSAKEALFKAIYPFVKKYLNFDSSIVVEILEPECHVVLLLNSNISNYFSLPKYFKVNFVNRDKKVITVVEILRSKMQVKSELN